MSLFSATLSHTVKHLSMVSQPSTHPLSHGHSCDSGKRPESGSVSIYLGPRFNTKSQAPWESPQKNQRVSIQVPQHPQIASICPSHVKILLDFLYFLLSPRNINLCPILLFPSSLPPFPLSTTSLSSPTRSCKQHLAKP